jgi:hypothetical protein
MPLTLPGHKRPLPKLTPPASGTFDKATQGGPKEGLLALAANIERTSNRLPNGQMKDFQTKARESRERAIQERRGEGTFSKMMQAKRAAPGSAENPNYVGLVPTGRITTNLPIQSLGSPTAASAPAPASAPALAPAPAAPRYEDPTGTTLGYRTSASAALGGGMGMGEDQYVVRKRLLGY